MTINSKVPITAVAESSVVQLVVEILYGEGAYVEVSVVNNDYIWWEIFDVDGHRMRTHYAKTIRGVLEAILITKLREVGDEAFEDGEKAHSSYSERKAWHKDPS